MHLVDEYLERAKAAMAGAENATGQELKSELRRLAGQWESLARARLELLEGKPNAADFAGNKTSERADSRPRG
jgi:hypothetical protein